MLLTGSADLQVVFEIWRRDHRYFVRVLFDGQPLETLSGLERLDMVTLEDFEGYLDSVIPANLRQACSR